MVDDRVTLFGIKMSGMFIWVIGVIFAAGGIVTTISILNGRMVKAEMAIIDHQDRIITVETKIDYIVDGIKELKRRNGR